MFILKFFRWLKFKVRMFFNPLPSIFYMQNMNTLPEKLSAAEELEALERLRGGDETVRKTLIERNLRLVVYIASKFERTGVAIEDLISIGSIGLIKAIRSFDANKQIKIATYASRCIENEILMHLRKVTKLKFEVSLDASLNKDSEGNELLLSDVLGSDPEETFKEHENEIEKKQLRLAVEALGEREKDIMQMRFGLDRKTEMTQKEVADELNISQSYISRLEKKILEKLKADLKKQEVEV